MSLSRDFILILGGGVVSLFTTLVVLFVSDYIYRRDELLYRRALPPPPVFTPPLPDTAAESQPIVPEEEKTAEGKNASPAPALATEVESET